MFDPIFDPMFDRGGPAKPLFADIKITLWLAEHAIPAVRAVCDKFAKLKPESSWRELDGIRIVLRYRGVHAYSRLEWHLNSRTFEPLDSFKRDMYEIRSELMAIDGFIHAHAEANFDTH